MFELNSMDRKVFETELADFLPAKIFDAHVHVFRRDFLPVALPANDYRQRFGGDFTYADWLSIAGKLMPGREIYSNIFGAPDVDIDRDASDREVGQSVDGIRCYGMALTSPDDSAAEIARRIAENRLIGYKPYLNFVRNKPAADIRIGDMLPAALLELGNEKKWIVTLHIPRSDRLADPINRRDMAEVCRRYPEVTFIFAHIGRAYYRTGVIGFLDELADCPNAWLDTAMVNHEWVLEYAFRNFPRPRLIFGSDAPIAMLRGKSVEINNQYAYLMGENYAIGTSMYDPNCKVNFTTFYYEQLRGIKLAAEAAGLNRREVEAFFFDNANGLFSKIHQLNYGK